MAMDPFAVVAEPTRRRLLDLLATGEQAVSTLVDRLGVSQPTVSKHLKVLRDAGLVSRHVRAQTRIYRIDATPLQAIDTWLAHYRPLWSDRPG